MDRAGDGLSRERTPMHDVDGRERQAVARMVAESHSDEFANEMRRYADTVRAEGAIEIWEYDLRRVIEWAMPHAQATMSDDFPGDSWNRLHMALSGVPCTADRRPLGLE